MAPVAQVGLVPEVLSISASVLELALFLVLLPLRAPYRSLSLVEVFVVEVFVVLVLLLLLLVLVLLAPW